MSIGRLLKLLPLACLSRAAVRVLILLVSPLPVCELSSAPVGLPHVFHAHCLGIDAHVPVTSRLFARSWAEELAKCIDNCTLKARKDGPLMGKEMHSALSRKYSSEAHGSQLTYIVNLYEIAKSQTAQRRTQALAEKDAILAANVAEWKADRERLLKRIDDARAVGLEHEERREMMRRDAEKLQESADAMAAKAAKLESYNVFELSTMVQSKQSELESVQEQLRAKQDALDVAIEARDAKEEELQQAKSEKDRERATSEAKFNACVLALGTALGKAQSAGQHGGYYFAAAASCPSLARRARAISPPLGLNGSCMAAFGGSPTSPGSGSSASSPLGLSPISPVSPGYSTTFASSRAAEIDGPALREHLEGSPPLAQAFMPASASLGAPATCRAQRSSQRKGQGASVRAATSKGVGTRATRSSKEVRHTTGTTRCAPPQAPTRSPSTSTSPRYDASAPKPKASETLNSISELE